MVGCIRFPLYTHVAAEPDSCYVHTSTILSARVTSWTTTHLVPRAQPSFPRPLPLARTSASVYMSSDFNIHARSHAVFAPVAARAVRCRRRMRCVMLHQSRIHAPRPCTHPSTHITHTAPPQSSHHQPLPPHHQPQPPPCPPPRLSPHLATTTSTTHAPRRHLDPTGHRHGGLGRLRDRWRRVDVRGRHGACRTRDADGQHGRYRGAQRYQRRRALAEAASSP